MSTPICVVDTTIHFAPEERARLEACYRVIPVDFTKPMPNLADEALADVLLVHSKVPKERLSAFTQCRYIAVRAHNTDYVDPLAAADRGILVEGIPQTSGSAVAEHTFALLFALSKQLLPSHRNVAEGNWRTGLRPNYELQGKLLGIVGYGSIGKLVATIGQALGMTVLVASKPMEESDGRLPLEEVLRLSDIVTVHASTREGQAPLIGQAQLAQMKDGAILINTARGKLVDYAALEQALASGKLSGAGLDVFPEEPVANESLCRLPNVICTPHVAFYTDQRIALMNRYVIDNVLRFHDNGQAAL